MNGKKNIFFAFCSGLLSLVILLGEPVLQKQAESFYIFSLLYLISFLFCSTILVF